MRCAPDFNRTLSEVFMWVRVTSDDEPPARMPYLDTRGVGRVWEGWEVAWQGAAEGMG